jgi:hypothetical protein
MAGSALKPGDHLRETAGQLYGRVGPEWIVEDIFVGTDGIDYARIALAADPSHRKTLSIAVLTDRRRFASVSAA